MKCNFYGSWIKQQLMGGFGVVLHDHKGDFIGAAVGSSEGISSAFHAELLAARQALVLAHDFYPSCASIIFEGDSSLALAAMKGQDEDCFLLGPIINDLHYLLKSFPQLLLNHVQGSGNFAALSNGRG